MVKARSGAWHADAGKGLTAGRGSAKAVTEPGFEFLAVGDWGDHGDRDVY
eukprot:gene28848-31329_t